MRITTWAEYGVICALNLAKRTDLGPVNGREIARQERLPADYVEQILLRLRRAGVIASTRGARKGRPSHSRDGLDHQDGCKNGAPDNPDAPFFFMCRRGDSNPHELAPTGS